MNRSPDCFTAVYAGMLVVTSECDMVSRILYFSVHQFLTCLTMTKCWNNMHVPLLYVCMN